MASVIDQIDLYLKKLSDSKQDSKQEEFLKGLYSIYISPSYLENRTSFDYHLIIVVFVLMQLFFVRLPINMFNFIQNHLK